jgi:hypothetical protein
MGKDSYSRKNLCSCVCKKILPSGLPRRMPCEKYSQVVGTLIPQESRTLHSNQHAAGAYHENRPRSNNILEKSLEKKRGKDPPLLTFSIHKYLQQTTGTIL